MARGFYIPLFNRANIQILIQWMELAPNSEFLVTINPSSGPVDVREAAFVYILQQVHQRGGTVIGYVFTDYAARSQSAVFADIDMYARHYPELDGIMFDEVSVNATAFNYYQNLANYARAQGLNFLRANPGANPPTSFFSLFDIVAIEEDAGYQVTYPDVGSNIDKASITIHSAPFNEAEIRRLAGYSRLVYVTDDSGDNPYDRMPTYWPQFAALIESMQIVPPPPPPPPPIECEPGFHLEGGVCVPDVEPPPPPPPGPGPDFSVLLPWMLKGLVAAITFAIMTSVTTQPAKRKEKVAG